MKTKGIEQEIEQKYCPNSHYIRMNWKKKKKELH